MQELPSSTGHERAAGYEDDQVLTIIRVTPRPIHPTLKTVVKAAIVAAQARTSA